MRFGPVELRESQQLRLQRLYPELASSRTRCVRSWCPKPMTARVGWPAAARHAVLRWASDLIRAVFLADIAAAADAAALTAAR